MKNIITLGTLLVARVERINQSPKFFIWFCAAAVAFAPVAVRAAEAAGQPQRLPPVEGAVVPPPPAGDAGDFLRVPINGIVIIGSAKELNPDGVPLKPGLTVTNNALLNTSEFSRLAGKYIGQRLDPQKMRELQREIVLYYRAHDRPLVDVLYPEQDASNGMLQIIVLEGRLKEVKVQNAKGGEYTGGWSGAGFLHSSIGLQTNEVISESQLLRDIDWLNRNPFRQVVAVYEPDQRNFGLSSVLLRVDEQRPWSVDVGYEDSGSRITSVDRLVAGVTWGKAFGLTDNLFRYAFTADPSFELLRVHSASYFMPLPWKHGLRFSGYYLDVKGDVDQNVTVSGAAYQASMRYEVPLPSFHKYQHEASIGVDFKSSDNNLFFNSVNVVNTPTEIFQIAAGYTSVLPDPWGRTSFSAQGYYSPGDMTEKNTDEDFNKSHGRSKANYMYARLNLERATRLPGEFSWILRGAAQVSDGNLLPSEQLGMGGYATVRGYDEREGNGDKGYLVSNELRTPPFSLLHLFSEMAGPDDIPEYSVLQLAKQAEEKIQLLGFFDYGQVSNVHRIEKDEDLHVLFASAGVGLRYSFSKHFALRFDYGWQLLDVGSRDDSRAHLGVTATY